MVTNNTKMKLLHYSRVRWLLILLIILITWEYTACEPPKIVKFTYRTKQLSLVDQIITSNIITLELDQDIYHQVQCPIEFSEANRTRIMPCCSSNTNATECYTPSNAAQTCLDGNGTYINITGTKDPYDYQRYALRVSNYASCHSISILNKAVSGNYNNYIFTGLDKKQFQYLMLDQSNLTRIRGILLSNLLVFQYRFGLSVLKIQTCKLMIP